MPRQWFVAQAVRHKEIAASLSAAQFGFQAYVPIIQRLKRRGRAVVPVSEPRFGAYIFVRFNAGSDPWENLCHLQGHRSYFVRVLCSTDHKPLPVPEDAMKAIRDFVQPALPDADDPIVYVPGQRVIHTIAGVRRDAVFVEYSGPRLKIRAWIMGADRVQEVYADEIAPVWEDIDTMGKVAV